MQTIDVNSSQMFYELDFLKGDEELLTAIKDCIVMQKKAGETYRETQYTPNPLAASQITGEALEQILSQDQDISDIRTHDISNCIVFHTDKLGGSVIDPELVRVRQAADEAMMKRIQEIFDAPDKLQIECSGHFWYPSGGYMGWHTNLRKPGWRMYVNYAEEEHRSFFRYRDPDTKEIVTCPDEMWNFRLFKITPEKPFWHCVFSETNRFSLGYKIDVV